MNVEDLKAVLAKHFQWLRSEPEGARANLTGADLYGTNLYDADLYGAKNAPLSASVSWSAHGECGRTLTALRHADAVTYRCGCFHGSASELRDYIANGEEKYRASRTVALDFVAARMAEMIANIGGV